MEILSIIPARGGSKGVPRKNIKLLNGKPLIGYTIEASLKSKKINRTIVSTDDDEIANIALSFNAEVPFIRPKELAKDDVLDFPVIEHALRYLKEHEDYIPDIVVYLRPTMPLRTSKEIDVAINVLLENKTVDTIRTVREAPYSPFWMKRISKEGLIEGYHDHVEPYVFKRRQDLPEVYICDGYVDAARTESIIKFKEFPPGKKLPVKSENATFIDIDTLDDWFFCEYYLKNCKNG